MGGFEPWQMSIALAIGGLLFFVGLFYWGGKFKDMRRTTIILYGIVGGAVMLVAAFGINHVGATNPALLLGLLAIAAGGLFVLAGATPAAIGLLADMTEAYPDDRGAIMGLYSVFLGLGQIIGSILGGIAAEAGGPRRDLRRVVRAARASPSCRSATCAATSTGSADASTPLQAESSDA